MTNQPFPPSAASRPATKLAQVQPPRASSSRATSPRGAETEQAPQVDAPPSTPGPNEQAAPSATPGSTPGSTPSATPGAQATAQAPAPAKAPPERKPLDQYKVLLHNDEHNEMMFVVQSIVQIVHLPTRKALGVMIEAHRSGLALVAVTHQELAELYRDQFASKGLIATIEKA